MPNPTPTPAPKGIGKFMILAGIILVIMMVTVFVGMSAQHTQTLHEQQAGNVKPQDAPMHEKDLGKSPASPK